MFTLKFFSDTPIERPGRPTRMPTYRAMEATSYEVSPADAFGSAPDGAWAAVVMHLADGSIPTWFLKGDEQLFIENSSGKTIDRLGTARPRSLAALAE